MHDCRLNGGHFFVYKPQGHAFRCRRCSERFINSYTDAALRHPWKCLIERCEYVACDPCSSILVEELANPTGFIRNEDRVSLKDLDMKEGEEEHEDEKDGAERILRHVTTESGEPRDTTKEMIPELSEAQKPQVIEADEDDEPYEIPEFICRTARQAAAEAAMKRAHIRARSIRRADRMAGGRAE